MSIAAYDSVRDDSGLFRAVHSQHLERRSQVVRKRTAPRPKPSRKALLWLAAAVLVIAAALAQPWKSSSGEDVETSESEAPARNVKVDRPSAATTASVVLPATIRPWQTTTLYARVSGYLKAWHHDLGAHLKAGELLAEIDTPELDQELAEAKSLASEATAAAVQAKAERTEAEADLKVAEGQLARIEADLGLLKSQLVRREKLVKGGNVTREEYDTFRKQTDARSADLAAQKADVARRRANLTTRAAIIEVREATAKSRQSNVARLEELQLFKRITAPFDGTVMRRTAEVGMLITAGQDALFAIEDTSRVRVQVNVPQACAAQTRPGVAAAISLPEATTPDVQATVTRIAESVDAASRTMLAEIELENPAHRWQPGSYVQVALTMPQDGTAWTIPTNTVSMRVEGPHIAVVNEGNQVELKPVRLGRDLGARVVVLEGIGGDERLIVNPGDDLTSGARVEVSPSLRAPTELAQVPMSSGTDGGVN
ncbi:MAG TPA: efflux RND transporter periplasmic adaptor subunit [Pirellulales bacterium]|nr:efflux RND transporter periplasmic adaptor subunit [Pirellulales bacterium]